MFYILYTTVQKCNASERSILCSPRLHLFAQKYSKTILNNSFLYFNILFNLIYSCDVFFDK